jgi:lipopolysaccharide/colanic/teichoic acid biosynthesis glycosyltransferase
MDIGLIVLFSPLILVIGAAVALMNLAFLGRPLFFRQVRPGRGGRPFEMIKFRSMTNRSDDQGCPLPDAERLNSYGRFLRSSSLDELPELVNVLRGEMSLVGPRPLLMEYLPLYSPEQARRLQVLPGITGWAQVNGRNAITWQDVFRFDLWYVEHMSPGLDLKILTKTLVRVLKRSDVSEPGAATRSKFTGNQREREEQSS